MLSTLGVKDHGNRTTLHIAASRGHVDIVKLLVLRFPDCCEKVDDKGNNVLHLIVPKKGIFATSGLSNIRWLRVRGLMNEKSVEGKTPPLHLFRMSIISPEMMLTWILDTLVRLFQRPNQRVSIRPSGLLEIKEDSDSSEESEEISEIKKTIKSHCIRPSQPCRDRKDSSTTAESLSPSSQIPPPSHAFSSPFLRQRGLHLGRNPKPPHRKLSTAPFLISSTVFALKSTPENKQSSSEIIESPDLPVLASVPIVCG
ncbi:hypothetical protein CK203_098780 [Vitis vinifera]|uniref:Uncharacterized protein n=1 Tax=Vitis vinifera TaxID=29760 RepID=A0A438CUQ7_VITVI|nr:hypothetical protein CK203_098780 [Vitis vinifera]